MSVVLSKPFMHITCDRRQLETTYSHITPYSTDDESEMTSFIKSVFLVSTEFDLIYENCFQSLYGPSDTKDSTSNIVIGQ